MPLFRLIPLFLLVPVLLFAAGEANFRVSPDKFMVGETMDDMADNIITLDQNSTSIRPVFPLKENRLYLRQKGAPKEYKWFVGSVVPENFKNVHAFSIAANHLKTSEMVMMRFYSAQNSKAFQDETNIFFDKEYIYSTRLTKLFFLKNGKWQQLKESTPPGIVHINRTDMGVEIASEDLDVDNGSSLLYPIAPGFYTIIFSQEGRMSYVDIGLVKPASVLRFTPKMSLAKASVSSVPKISVTKEMVRTAQNLEETEFLYDKFMLEMQSSMTMIDSSEFNRVYPKRIEAAAFSVAPAEFEYNGYVARYNSKRNEAYTQWKKSQMSEILEIEQVLKNKLDSLEAPEYRTYLLPVAVNPVYEPGVVIPTFVANPTAASPTLTPVDTTPSPIVVPESTTAQPVAPVAASAPAEATPSPIPVPEPLPEPIGFSLRFGHDGDRYDVLWKGSVDGIPSSSLIEMIQSGKAQVIATLQNNKPVWVVRNGVVVDRHQYRYVAMEIEINGNVFEAVGEFVLPEYILREPEVQEWLHPKPVVVSSSSAIVVPMISSSSSEIPVVVEEEPEENPRIIKDKYRGDVALIDSGEFRYYGHVVSMSDFAIHTTEVTQQLYALVMDRLDSAKRVKDKSTYVDPKKPVHNVNWQTAKDFCEILGGDLPTEAQWVYAGLADNDEGLMWNLDASPNVNAYAVYEDNSYKLGKKDAKYGPQRVAERKPNAWGIYDMSGNVAEWTRDKYFALSFWIEDSNPSGALMGSHKVYKGGSWKDSEKNLNLVSRDDEDPRYWSETIGFRCVFPRKQFERKRGK